MLKKTIFLAFLLIAFTNLSYTIPVFVNVKESLEGYFPYFNYSENSGIVEIIVMWENSGSVTCDAWLRIDVKDNKTKLGTYWSEMENIPPGGNGIFDTLIYIPNISTNLTLTPIFYYCNEIKKLEDIQLNNYNYSSNSSQEMINISINYDYEIINNQTLSINISLPVDYENKTLYLIANSPIGWKLPSKKINYTPNKTIALTYYRPARSDKTASYLLIDNEGKILGELTINFEKQKKEQTSKVSLKDIALYSSLILNLILLLAINHLIRKIKYLKTSKK